jgi:hypothetical protein
MVDVHAVNIIYVVVAMNLLEQLRHHYFFANLKGETNHNLDNLYEKFLHELSIVQILPFSQEKFGEA